MFNAKLKKIGGSYAVYIPKHIVNELNINEMVRITIKQISLTNSPEVDQEKEKIEEQEQSLPDKEDKKEYEIPTVLPFEDKAEEQPTKTKTYFKKDIKKEMKTKKAITAFSICPKHKAYYKTCGCSY
jgi:antitoxin component of MazEF toxin-antitoxin module